MQNLTDSFSLDGKWQILFDWDNKGKKLGWNNTEKFLSRYDVETIDVPSCWEEYMLDYEGVGWYHKSFYVPEEWRDRCVHLNFAAVNFRTEVWLNDQIVGVHEGGYTGFSFEIEKTKSSTPIVSRILSWLSSTSENSKE